MQAKTVSNAILSRKTGKELWKDAGLMLICILISRVTILDGLSPFGISFFASVFLFDLSTLPAFLGCMVGTISANSDLSLYYGVAYLIFFVAMSIISKRKTKVGMVTVQTALIGSLAISKLLYHYIDSMLLYDILLAAADIFIAALMVYVFSSVLSVLVEHNKRTILSNEEVICITFFAALIILGSADMEIYTYSLRNILSIFLIMLFAYIGGTGIGASMGITLGVILSLGSRIDPFLIGNLGVCGLLAGTFRPLKKMGSIGGFILANSIITFYVNKSTIVLIPFKEIVVAAVILLICPKFLIDYLKQFVDGSNYRLGEQKYYIQRMRDLTVGRLREFSEVFTQMAVVFDRIVEGRRRMSQEEISRLFDIVASRVCSQCALKQSCWKRDFYSTYQYLFDILAVAESKGRIDGQDIPEELRKRCLNVDNLAAVLNDVFDIYRTNLKWQNKIDESRLLVGQQLDGVSKVISDLASELNVDIRFKNDLETMIREELDKIGIRVKEVLVQENSNGKMEVHIVKRSCGGKRECTRQIAKVISKVLGKKMAVQDDICRSSSKGQCVLVYKEALTYLAMTGVARKAKDGRDVCGDSYSFFGLKDGKYLLAVSDGMGSGSRASEESSATVSLLEHFYEAGFQQEIIFRTINSILMLRSSEEMFSTVDLCVLDLIEGYGDFVKIGAASTYIKRGDEVEVIRAATLPMGIVEDIQPEVIRRGIKDGDFIIMVTDGITDTIGTAEEQDSWMAGLLGEIRTQSPQEMADAILKEALEYGGGVARDDMTVMVTRIWGKEKH